MHITLVVKAKFKASHDAVRVIREALLERTVLLMGGRLHKICFYVVLTCLFAQMDDISIPVDVKRCLTDGHKRTLSKFGLFI